MNATRWTPVPNPDFSHAYSVSDTGEIARTLAGQGTKTGAVKQRINKKTKYLYVNLCARGIRKTFSVHRLVCQAFHGDPPTEYHQVAHNDGSRTNNSACNLRWATFSENEQDKIAHGTIVVGERSSHAKLSSEDVIAIRNAVYAKEERAEIAKRFGIHKSYVSALARNDWRRHDGAMV